VQDVYRIISSPADVLFSRALIQPASYSWPDSKAASDLLGTTWEYERQLDQTNELARRAYDDLQEKPPVKMPMSGNGDTKKQNATILGRR